MSDKFLDSEDNFYDEEEFNTGVSVEDSLEDANIETAEHGESGIATDSEDTDTVLEEVEEEIEPNSFSLDMPGSVEAVDDSEEGEAVSYSLDLGDMEVEESDDDDVLSAEERLRVFSDQIMSCVVGKKEVRNYVLNKLIVSATPKLFRDENYIIFCVLYAFRDRIRRLNIDSDFIKMYLNRNRGLITKSRLYIDINAYEEIEGSKELGYISGVVKHFRRLEGMPEISVEEFELIFEKYLIEFKAIEAAKIYAKAKVILTEGITIGKKYYFGFEDSDNYVRRSLAELEGLVDMKKGSGYINMKEILEGNKGEEKKSYKVADFDRLQALNEYYGGIYTGMFYQVMAPLKAGKSKLCARINHTAAIKYGTNCSVWAKEGGAEAWTAQLRAIHFDYVYNQGASITERKYGVDQDVILKGNFPDDSLKELEMSSKLDLQSNTDYGSIDYIDQPFELETFIDAIDTSVKSNGSKLLIIDYLQLITSRRNLSKNEVIGNAYIALLDYCKTNNIAVITPAQYKQAAIEALLSKGNTADSDMRTAGGESAEVLRSPDITFALWATTSDIANNVMKILSMPSRFAKPFPEIPCYTDLGTCQFISVDNKGGSSNV